MTWNDIAKLFAALELELIQSFKRNLQKHLDWEKQEGFDWPAWQEEKLRQMEDYRKRNRQTVYQYRVAMDAETRAMLEEQFAEGERMAEREILEDRATPGRDGFFGVNDRRLDSLSGDMLTVEHRVQEAALRTMDDVYRRTLYKAELAMATGATTLPKAIDMAAKEFLSKGINCIEYKDGRRVNIADYAQMALRTAAIRSYLQGEAKRRVELGIDTVLVSQYGACSETCLPWQGRVYIDDVWGGFAGETDGTRGKSRNGRWYPLLSGAIAGGLFHPNCRHTLSAWVEGVSKLPPPMDKEKIRQNAKLEQKQRQLEREVRSWKRLAEGSVDPQNAAMYGQRVKQAQRALREFVGEHSDVLRRDYWRETTNQVPADYAPVPLQSNGAGGILKAGNAPANTGQDLRYNPEADFDIWLPNYSEVVNAGLSAASRKVAQLGGQNQREYLSLVDLSNGGEVYFEQGEEGSVGGPAFWDVVRSNPSGSYCFVHNHNREGGFSERDLHTLLTTSSIRAFAAIGVDGMKFFVEKTGTKPSTGFFDKLYPDDISKINALYASGKITAGERTGLREQLLVENVIRDYTKGLVVLDGRTGKE